MRSDLLEFDAATRAAVCAAALTLAALAQGCAQTSSNGGGPAARPPAQSAFAQPSPARAAQPAGESPLPAPKGFVSDFADVIDGPAEGRLEARLRRLKERTKIEIAVATVGTTGGRSIYEYSLAVARGWGIGPPAGEEGGGVLLLLASEDRKWRVQVSRSLEADLPDEVVGQIGSRMAPTLREGRYADAVNGCVDEIVKRLAERRGFSTEEDGRLPQPPPEASPKPAARPNAGDTRKSAAAGKP
ncbi:MAG TPA: TPM domain-containing protein [Pyrinomonadaceae bacterium]|jgi:uncharacterized protein